LIVGGLDRDGKPVWRMALHPSVQYAQIVQLDDDLLARLAAQRRFQNDGGGRYALRAACEDLTPPGRLVPMIGERIASGKALDEADVDCPPGGAVSRGAGGTGRHAAPISQAID